MISPHGGNHPPQQQQQQQQHEQQHDEQQQEQGEALQPFPKGTGIHGKDKGDGNVNAKIDKWIL